MSRTMSLILKVIRKSLKDDFFISFSYHFHLIIFFVHDFYNKRHEYNFNDKRDNIFQFFQSKD